MIRILIQGLNDGLHEVNQDIPTEEVDNLFPEFFGDILLLGKLRKLGNRFSFVGTAECQAKMKCDRTLRDFEQKLIADISVSFLADNSLSRGETDKPEILDAEDQIIKIDDKYIDLTDEVREQLALQIPMRKIAPEVEDKELEDIYPEHSSKNNINSEADEEIDDRWKSLKNIKLN